METFMHIMKRRSIRSYTSERITNEQLDMLLAAANAASGTAPVHFSVVQEKILLKEISEETLKLFRGSGNINLVNLSNIDGYDPLYKAPAVVFISSPAKNTYGGPDCFYAAAFMEIMATSIHLGSCCVVSVIPTVRLKDIFKKQIGIPKGNIVHCCVVIGHPDNNVKLRKSSNPLSVNFVK